MFVVIVMILFFFACDVTRVVSCNNNHVKQERKFPSIFVHFPPPFDQMCVSIFAIVVRGKTSQVEHAKSSATGNTAL